MDDLDRAASRRMARFSKDVVQSEGGLNCALYAYGLLGTVVQLLTADGSTDEEILELLLTVFDLAAIRDDVSDEAIQKWVDTQAPIFGECLSATLYDTVVPVVFTLVHHRTDRTRFAEDCRAMLAERGA